MLAGPGATEDEQLIEKLKALLEVANAIKGLDGATVNWIFETLKGFKPEIGPFPTNRPESEAKRRTKARLPELP